jgi:hypothetical protein
MPLSAFSMGDPVKPEVEFLAKEFLQNLDNVHNEEVYSDHELEELPELVKEEVSSDDELSEVEEVPLHPNSYKRRQKKKYRDKRAVKRLAVQQNEGTTLKTVALKKRSASRAQGIPSSLSYQEEFIPSKPVWKAKPDNEKDEKEYSLEELVNDFGMKVIFWDGR